MIVPRIKVKSKDELYERVQNGDLELARVVIRGILKNLKADKLNLIVAEVIFEEDSESYELTCHSDEFIVTLEKNLKVLVDAEAYEECSKVVSAIKYLRDIKTRSYDIQI
jgi:hypothetical protein